MFSGGNLSQTTIFGLGIMPYISASIIFQLLGSVWPPLEKLQKEGESGRKKINEYTRYSTVLICFFQAYMYVNYIMGSPTTGGAGGWALPGYSAWLTYPTMVITMTTGTVFLMWIGEQIDEYGIGNGISLIIMAGIIARMPMATVSLFFEGTNFNWQTLTLGGTGSEISLEKIVVLAVLFVVVVVAVVAITKGRRLIPTQSAKHVRGRRVFGGTRQNLPLMRQPGRRHADHFRQQLARRAVLHLRLDRAAGLGGVGRGDREVFQRQGWWYTILFIAMIYVFCYFWTAIVFNPKDMANNLKDYGSFIPGYRPGKRTAEYLERVMVRITYVGAAFLAAVAVIPTSSPPPGRQLHGGQLLRRNRPADRHQRRARPRAKDQQPPGHAQLPRPDRGLSGGAWIGPKCQRGFLTEPSLALRAGLAKTASPLRAALSFPRMNREEMKTGAPCPGPRTWEAGLPCVSFFSARRGPARAPRLNCLCQRNRLEHIGTGDILRQAIRRRARRRARRPFVKSGTLVPDDW